MLKKVRTNEGIQYKKLSPEEMKARGILGRLIGPCADFNNATRNGRKYSEQLWENVFNDPIMQEKIKNGVCFGELGHPEDRTEIDMEKIAVCLREQPVKNEKGQLCAVFDILDTPNGRILKTLCDYGSTVGVSSRGQGDIITDIHGEEAVDPDTYECECWDIVLVPAVESARMTYVKEGLENKRYLKLKKALAESLNNATEEDKKVMKETLEELNINLSEDINITNNDSPGRQEAPRTNNNAPEEKPTEVAKTDEGLGLFGIGDVNVNLDASGQNNAVGLGASQPKNEDLDEDDDYEELADQFIKDTKTMTLDQAKDWFFNEYEFNKKAPEDDVEQKIFDALKARIEELGGKLEEGILSGISGLANGLGDGLKDIPVVGPLLASDEAEKADQEENAEEAPIEVIDDVEVSAEAPVDEIPLEEPTEEDQPVDEPIDEPVDEPVEDTRTDEEIFFDYLKANFDEKQIKKACKALDIEVPEDEEENKEDEEAPEDEAEESEESPTEVQDEEEPKEDEEDKEEEPVDESLKEGKECNGESCADKKEEANEVVEESAPAINDGDAALLKSLQEALKGKSDLEGSVKSLQEKLAVSDTKVNELTEENNNYKKAIARLATMSKSNKDLRESVTKLEESLKEKDATIDEQKSRIARLVKSRKESVTESASLNESVQTKTQEVSTLTESLNKANADVTALNEKLSNSDKEISELNENLNKATTLKEAYKKLANKAVNKYIDIKATTLGLTSTDIKRKLGESYTLEDVDQVCEDLKAYQLNVSKLPFSIDRKVGVRVNEAAPRIKKKVDMFGDDDEVDDSLIKLAKSSGVKF